MCPPHYVAHIETENTIKPKNENMKTKVFILFIMQNYLFRDILLSIETSPFKGQLYQASEVENNI